MGSKSVPITEDYAVIALVPAKGLGRWVAILAGTRTIGTEAAVEYVFRYREVSELESRVGNFAVGGIQPFEAVIRSKVAGGVPVSTQLVALHMTGVVGGTILAVLCCRSYSPWRSGCRPARCRTPSGCWMPASW